MALHIQSPETEAKQLLKTKTLSKVSFGCRVNWSIFQVSHFLVRRQCPPLPPCKLCINWAFKKSGLIGMGDKALRDRVEEREKPPFEKAQIFDVRVNKFFLSLSLSFWLKNLRWKQGFHTNGHCSLLRCLVEETGIEHNWASDSIQSPRWKTWPKQEEKKLQQ